VRRDRARQRCTGDDDRLERGLERSTPALPAFGFGRGGCGRQTVHRSAALALSRVVMTGAFLPPGEVATLLRPTVAGRESLSPSGLINCLRHVQRLRKPRAVQPRDGVPQLEPGILDSYGHS